MCTSKQEEHLTEECQPSNDVADEHRVMINPPGSEQSSYGLVVPSTSGVSSSSTGGTSDDAFSNPTRSLSLSSITFSPDFRPCSLSVSPQLFDKISLSETYHDDGISSHDDDYYFWRGEDEKEMLELSARSRSLSLSSSLSHSHHHLGQRGCMIIRKQEDSVNRPKCEMYLNLYRKRRLLRWSSRPETSPGGASSSTGLPVARTPPSPPSPPPAASSKPCSVTFGKVEIKKYQNIMGDNPSGGTGGTPLTIQWEPFQTSVYQVEDFERVREESVDGGRRLFKEMVTSPQYRQDLILRDENVSMIDIVKNKRVINKVKLERQATRNFPPRKEQLEERMELIQRLLKNAIFARGEKRKEREFLLASRKMQEVQNLEADRNAAQLFQGNTDHP